MQLSDKQNLALVLSGGGIKASAFHIGVCIALREKGFKFAGGSPEKVATHYADNSMTFKTYVGSSAGSVISTFLAAGHSIDTIINAFTRGAGIESMEKRYKPGQEEPNTNLKALGYSDIFSLNLKAGYPSRFLSRFWKKRPVISGGLEVLFKRGFKVNGIFTTKNIEKYIRKQVVEDNRFSSLGVQLYIVATQLNHSRKVIFGAFDETSRDQYIKYANYATISDSVAASASLPPAFAPYGIHNNKGKLIHFFDGEIRDTLSTHVAADHGADLVIASYSIQPYHYNDEIGSLHEYGVPMIINQALYQVVQQKIERHILYKKNINQLIQAVNGYLKEANIDNKHREKLIEILIQKTQFNPNVDYIYIHPSPQDYEMFFADHFSLSPRILSKIVRTGFKSAINALRHY